ncbi:sigma-54-dependent Fis family transcriptional regulator [Thermocrinis minervae]|uniref:Nif-specific regulatory protein n=1 Tax=Thermocrinis minervae TaxID=381751 RepID=A0A1M6Q7H2_9AQUI|nr:sigma 54-interacting transcriptional regulator [Thermocrinis minervae]SHK16202.1 Nif-specific regulatory protein [Thermocrinis minervae]
MAKREVSIKEIGIVNEVAKVLSRGQSFEEASLDVLKVLYSFWNISRGLISLYDKNIKSLRVVASFGSWKKEVKREDIWDKVYKNGIPMFLSEGSESFFSVPIKVGGEVIGVLSLYKELGPKDSVESALEMLLIVCTMLGMAYKLDERMQEQKKEWEEEKEELTKVLQEKYSLEGIIGRSPAVKNLIELILKVAKTDVNVLITGESGVGKSLIAKAIHFQSSRKNRPFVTINCSAIPETLLEAELFGYERGAFTGAYTSKKGKFELAEGGTVFLDEVGDMPLSLQPKLLRVVQEKEIERLGGEHTIKVDVRIISATNKDLKKLVEDGLFREDLYYRLSVFPIHVPPLRERKEDIPVLVDHFLQLFNKRYNKKVGFDTRAMDVLMEYPWPGNVRELESTVERLVILKDGLITPKDLPSYLFSEDTKEKLKNLPSFVESTEREEIIKALEKTGYVKSRAAKLLGLTLRQLDYRIKKYRIPIKGS